MPETNENELLKIVTLIGKRLIEYGAEMYRAEESIQRICAACGHSDTEVFAIPAYLSVTVYGKNGEQYTRTAAVSESRTDLDKAGEYSGLCRRICAEKLTYDEILSQIADIERRPCYGNTVQLLGYMAVGLTFALFFGGDQLSALLGAVAAAAVFFLDKLADRYGGGLFFRNILCSAAAALLAVTVYKCGVDYTYDKTITGAVMTMVPGVCITNGMRDFISGDLLAGLYTIAEAFTSAVALAVGAGSVLALLEPI